MELNIFPWDRKEKPYWINPENGLEWYIDKLVTSWCINEKVGDLPKLNAVCFIVVEKNEKGERNPISRVLINKETNDVLADETSLEAMGAKIDMIRVSKTSADMFSA